MVGRLNGCCLQLKSLIWNCFGIKETIVNKSFLKNFKSNNSQNIRLLVIKRLKLVLTKI